MFLYDIINTYLEFLYAPIIHFKILWILLPTIWAILLMELYFDRYSREGIGHHKSLENTIFLLFISANLLSVALQHPIIMPKLYLSIIFIAFSVAIGLMDFFHKLPTTLLFKGSSKFMIALLAYVSIVLVYSNLLSNLNFIKALVILISIILVFITFLLIIKFIAFFEPKSYEEIEHFLKNIEDDIKRAHEESLKDSKELKKDESTKLKKIEKLKKENKKNKNSKKIILDK